MKSQITDTLLMIRPAAFRMNEQTAVNNFYQDTTANIETATERAQREFDAFVALLKSKGIRVIVVEDNPETDTPDAVFPNNWVSFHASAEVALYPMYAENRRLERRMDVLERLEAEGFFIEHIIDYSAAEDEAVFLEGTGSLVLDRVHKIAYCALSPRASEELLDEFCEDFGYFPVAFHAYQTHNNQRALIYHTNVMMALGENFAVVCLDCIDHKAEKKLLVEQLSTITAKEIIAITEAQVAAFAGNMLQVKNTDGKAFTVLSKTAHDSLTKAQKNQLLKHNELIVADIPTIETLGGGSVRCMLAEVFLPKKPSPSEN
ncbi:MAG: arginine deiminase-related protein [Flavobacteriaceae bacterium]|nr:arginine deiminase-related protein [Flavobacteriaceae bacterium]